ncbi:RING finger protein 17-like [Amphiura filiformis]|uniref:RING finger protein 17-like n=1 Tax=Amphiura filiformis TaxID=82378 RepID=UPI003B2197D1
MGTLPIGLMRELIVHLYREQHSSQVGSNESIKLRRAGHGYAANRAYERANSASLQRTAFQPETKALVLLVHIRNPCYFFVQRETDQNELGAMMAKINSECNRMRENERMPENIEPGLMCCAKYMDGRWYRARVKRFVEAAPPKKPHHKDSKKSKRKKSSRSSDAESSKDESEDKISVKDEEVEKEGDEGKKKEEDVSKDGDAVEDEGDLKKKDKEAAKSQESDDEDVDVDVEESSEQSVKSTNSVKSSHSAKSSNSAKSSHSAKSTQSAKSSQNETSDAQSASKQAVVELMVEVVYVDFGNTEIVPVSKLCKLRTKLQRCPEMAVCCSLIDIVPNNYDGKWTADVNQGFAGMVGQAVVQMSVQASAGVLLYVDLHKLPNDEVEDDMPVSLRDALVFFELACFKTPESMPKDTWRQNRSYLGADLPKAGESISATISHINNPGSFYVQELGDDLEYLLSMMKDLQEQYKKREQERWGILCPQIGMICVAKFELDSQWYRAQIIGLPGKQLVELVYVDYGNLDTVHCSNLRKVTNQFLKLPVQALPCSLADVEPMEDPADGWPQQVAGAFFELVAQKTLKVIVKTNKDGCLSVVLLYEDGEDEKELCANAELVRGGNATSTGPSSTVLPFGAQGSTPTSKDLNANNKKQVTNGAVSPGVAQNKAKKHTTKSAITPTKAKKESSKKQTGVYTKVHVSHIESPACIYVQLATAGKDGLDSLLEAMTLHYKDSEQEDCVWQEGDICCALLVREKVWCRARIKTVLPDDKAVVLFSDYGNTEIIDLTNVRPLEERFQQSPPLAIQCHLADVIPAGDKHKWTKTACEFLITKLADLECCIVKKGELVAGSLPIDLLYEISIKEKLERETTEDLFSISKLLKQKGLAFAPRKPRAKGHIRSASPTHKTSPKTAVKTTSPVVHKPAPQTSPESTEVKQEVTQEPSVNGVDKEQELAKENGHPIDMPAMQVAHNTQNALGITHDTEETTQKAVKITHDALVPNDPVSAVQKMKDPSMQPLPVSGDSDSDFMSDSGPAGERQVKKEPASPGKVTKETTGPSELVEEVPETLDDTQETSITPPEATDTIPDTTESPPVEPERRLSPPVVVLDSSSDKDAISYKARPPPSADAVELVVTYVNQEAVIFGVEVDEVENLQKLTTKLQAEMAARPPGTDVSFYKGQPVCANFTQDGLWYRAKVLGGTQQGVKVQYIDFGNIEIAAPDKIQPIAFEPDIPQKSQGCKLIELYPPGHQLVVLKEPDTNWPKTTIDILLSTLLEQTCGVEIKSLCSEGKPWKVDLKLPNGDSLRQLLLDHGYAQEGGESSSSLEELEEVESEEETGDGSSGISSSAVSSSATGSDAPSQINQAGDAVGVVENIDPRQIVTQDVVLEEEEEEEDRKDIDVRKYILAGTGITYKSMRLPDAGIYFGAQVTQVDQPDLLYIQIVPSPAGNSDPMVHRSAEELYILGELIKDLNRMAPELPRLQTSSMKPGQVCCALYELDLQYYRGKIIGMRDHGEKLVQVQYVDYGNSDWHSPDSLRQIPDKFINLPAQARKCKIIGMRPPKDIPEGDTLLLDTDWPISSGRRMVELVNNKQLVAVVKYDAEIPGIQLFDAASEIPMQDPQPADGLPLHVRLVSDQLAELDSEEEDSGKSQETEV